MLAGVSIVLFLLMHVAPGGPEAALLGGDISKDTAAQLRRSLGLEGIVRNTRSVARCGSRGAPQQSAAGRAVVRAAERHP